MSNIPHARKILIGLYKKLKDDGNVEDAEAIVEAIEHLFRRAPIRKMGQKSPPITANIRAHVIDLATTTNLHTAEIAAIFNINPGRVSEILQKHLGVN